MGGDVHVQRGRNRAILGIGDQVLYSGTNLLTTIAVAREATASGFGAFSVVLASFLIGSAVTRGLLSEPLLIKMSNADWPVWHSQAQSALSLGLLFGILWGMLLGTLGVFGGFWEIGAAFAVATPLLFGQDLLRYAALATARPWAAVCNDGVVAILEIVSFAFLFYSGNTSPWQFVVAWGVCSAFGAVVGAIQLRLRPSYNLRLAAPDAFGRRLGSDNFLTQMSQQGVTYLVALFVGLGAAGGLRAAQTVLMPPGTIMLGVQVAVTPELVRIRAYSSTGFRRAVYLTMLALLLLTVPYYGFALFGLDQIGGKIFGSSWPQAKDLLPFLGVAMVSGAVMSAAVSGLRALSDGRRTLEARISGIVLTQVIVIPGVLLFGLSGVAVGLAIAGPLQALVWWLQFRRSERAARAES